jgi:sugar O-acyltransferase (sialic acid O-acetyltransferase NeuD family)
MKERKFAMKDMLIIIGASGHGKVAADIAIKMNNWQNISFLDDDETLTSCMDFEILGKTGDAFKYKNNADFFVAVGNNETREYIQEEFEKEGLSIVSLIHPNAVIGSEVQIGAGTVVMAGAVINSSSIVGKGCIINTSCSIDHDNMIGNYVHISPGSHLAGTVQIGKGCWLGVGSVVSNNINICSGCTIGAGAVVINDINDQGTYIGVPARRRL